MPRRDRTFTHLDIFRFYERNLTVQERLWVQWHIVNPILVGGLKEGDSSKRHLIIIRRVRRWIDISRTILVALKFLAPVRVRGVLELIDTFLDTVDGFLQAVEDEIVAGGVLWTW